MIDNHGSCCSIGVGTASIEGGLEYRLLSLVHSDGVDAVDEEAVEVFCVSQNPRSLSDPAVEDRVCLIANLEAVGPLQIKGTTLDDYIVIHYQHMLLVCFEAFEILEQNFTDILKSTGGLKEHETFVRQFRKSAAKSAAAHNVPILPGKSWVQCLQFGVFAEAVSRLQNCLVRTDAQKEKLIPLKEYAEGIFQDVLSEGLDLLKEESEVYQIDYNFDGLKSSLVQEVVNEWACAARNRSQRNTIGHPFGASSPHSLRRATLKFYEKCLEHDVTKGFRTVAHLGKVKLKIDEQKLKQSQKTVPDPDYASDVLPSDESGDDMSDDDDFQNG